MDAAEAYSKRVESLETIVDAYEAFDSRDQTAYLKIISGWLDEDEPIAELFTESQDELESHYNVWYNGELRENLLDA